MDRPHPPALGDTDRSPQIQAREPAAKLQMLRMAMVGCTLALIVLGLAWELWLAPTGGRTLALKVLPLAFALPGLVRHRLYTARWLALLVWLYVTEGLVRATSDVGWAMGLAIVEVMLATLLFIACGAYVRMRLAAGDTAKDLANGSANDASGDAAGTASRADVR